MKKFGSFICNNKKLIIIISVILLVLSFIGMKLTRINYDILVYLPQDNETIIGQNILTDDFHMGAYSIAIIDNMNSSEIIELENEIKEVDCVNKVVSLYDVIGTTIPVEMLPSEVTSKLHNDNTDLLLITFNDSTSSEATINAVKEIRKLTDERVKLGGMSSMVLDTMELSDQEIITYIVIAVILCVIVLEVSLDSYIVPFLLLGNIGFSILLNLGTNIFLGEISYITKALVAVLQLGVTTDFSIFLYHSYENRKKTNKDNNKAMTEAIGDTFASVTGSSLTTIAGFLVLCTMQLTLGKDLGIVMAKGVFLGVVSVLTLFPSLLLFFEKLVEKTKHKNIMPKFDGLNKIIIKCHKVIFAIFIILLVPFYLANSKIDVYYKIDKTLPNTLESIISNERIKDEFGIVSQQMILVSKDLDNAKLNKMINKIENVDGVDFVLSSSKLSKFGITNNMLSDEVNQIIENDNYKIVLLNSLYDIASDELNEQVEEINTIVKKYDSKAIVAGEGSLMKDLIKISDQDFKNVNVSSIVCIFIILFIVLRLFSLPFLLITAIEFAIFMNMGISYFKGDVLPFVAPIVLGTIQLGATIDYAILMTTTYLKKRKEIADKEKAMLETLNYCGTSILVSGMCFFAATFGVGAYSKLEMVGSLCTLISRGSIISMLVVITVLPSILLLGDKFILKTTKKERSVNMKKKSIKVASIVSLFTIMLSSGNVSALTKKEMVYSKLDSTGKVTMTLVNEHLENTYNEKEINDYSELENILNINSKDKYESDSKNKLCWKTKGNDIFYQGITDKELPVKVDVVYKLNGVEKDIDNILGKKGKVSITLKYTNLDKHVVNGEVMYTPFIVTVGTMLDSNVNHNVAINNGKVVSTGTNEMIVGLVTPGLYESLKIDEFKNNNYIEISFDTDSFALPSIYSVITPKLIDINDLSVFNKLNTVYSSVDKLQSSMNQINDGANSLKSGSNLLKSKLLESITTLKNASGNALSEEQINGVKEQVKLGLDNKFTDEYKNAIANSTWEKVQSELANSNANPVDSSIIVGYGSEYVKKVLTDYLGGEEYLQDYAICGDQTGTYANIQQAKCAELATHMGVDISNPETALSNIQKMMASIYSLQTSLTNNISSTLNSTANYVGNTVKNATAETITKKVAVEASVQAAYQTAEEVSSQVALSVGNEVKNTMLEMVTSSLETLYGGVDQLDSGINTLSNGITDFNNQGINKLSTMANTVKNTSYKINKLIELGNNYESFGGKLDSTDGDTKMVLVIEGKSKEVKVKKETKSEKKTSLWDRFLNLFK